MTQPSSYPDRVAGNEGQYKKIEENWDLGYALSKHTLSSEFTGYNEYGHPTFDTTRSEPGEALYQLKYRSDWSKVEPLAEEINKSLLPLFNEVGLIVPMCASVPRERQPVNEVARHLGKITNIPVFENLLSKSASPEEQPQLKNMGSKEEKDAALAGRFSISNEIGNEGTWNVLIVDDLFDTGASMDAACTALKTYSKIGRVYVAAITWK
jgi:predicted amidophosphoribosyltransferase